MMAHKRTRGHDPPKEPVMIPVSEVALTAKAHGAPVWGAAAGTAKDLQALRPVAKKAIAAF
jgi:hypothetical protein